MGVRVIYGGQVFDVARTRADGAPITASGVLSDLLDHLNDCARRVSNPALRGVVRDVKRVDRVVAAERTGAYNPFFVIPLANGEHLAIHTSDALAIGVVSDGTDLSSDVLTWDRGVPSS